MRKTYFCFVLFFSIYLNIFSLDYLTTAQSVGWNGAYSSVATGFEALLYNPAGLFVTNRKFGISIMGSYGFRFYNNTLSTDDFINIYGVLKSDNPDLTAIINNKLSLMSDLVGWDTGINIRNSILLTYMKFQTFSLGFTIIHKSDTNVVLSKSIFSTVLKNLNLSQPLSTFIKANSINYLDINTLLSTRATFLEKYIKVDSIYAGIGSHLYLPTALTIFDLNTTLTTGTPDSQTGLYSYDAKINGNMKMFTNIGLSEIFKTIPSSNFPAPVIYNSLTNSGSFAIGFGFDLGFIVKFNKYVKLGFAVTDLGFFIIPEIISTKYDFTINISPTRIQEFGKDLLDKIQEITNQNAQKISQANFFMPPLAFRVGVGFIPISVKGIDVIIPLDISLTDFHKLLTSEYVTFNFATGIEVRPKFNWFEIPFRLAFSYNSQANYPSLSMGSGLVFGPVQFEFGLKGLEILISDFGTKEFSLAFDMKLEF